MGSSSEERSEEKRENRGDDPDYAQELEKYRIVEQDNARKALQLKGVWTPTARDLVNQCIKAREEREERDG